MSVSIVIPCHNAASYIGQAIASALLQTHPPDEVIVVDDGSTDESLTVARRFETRFPDRVRVLAERSAMASRTRNLGALAASGETLMFLDADDVLGPEALAALVGALGERPGGVAVCPWYRLESVRGRWVERPPSCAPRGPRQDPLSAWLTGWYHPPCSVLWSREAFERAGRWEERWNPNDDGDLMMRALAAGIPFLEAAAGSAYYRRMPEGETSLSGARLTREGLKARLRTCCKVAAWLEEHGRLDRYRSPLVQAFSVVATDASVGHPDLAAEAAALARRYQPSMRSRPAQAAARMRRRAHLGWHQVQRGIDRRLPIPLRAGSERTEATEIRFGLDLADDVARGTSSIRPLTLGVDRPTVSVIIPTYNRAGLLARALDSVLSQTMTDYEVLVVDDGSTDDSAGVVAGYRDQRIRYLRQRVNQGVSAARNRGLREARGDFIAFLDSDDEWFPDKLSLQLQCFRRAGEDVGLVYGGVEHEDEFGQRDVRTPRHRGDVYHQLLAVNVILGTSAVMMRRSVVAVAGFFDEGIPAIEDYDYWIRLSRFYEVEYVTKPLIRYHDSGTLLRKSLAVRDNLEARAWLYRKHRGEMRRAGVAHRYLLDSARRHMKPACGDRRSARGLALRALREAPWCSDAYRVLALACEPRSLQRLRRSLAGRRSSPSGTTLRILLYSSTPRGEVGGVQSVLAQLSADLRRRGHTVRQAWYDADAGTEDAVYRLELPRMRGALPSPGTVVPAVRALLRLAVGLARLRPAVVNVHFVRPHAWHFVLLRSVFRYKLVLSVHGSDVLLASERNAALLPPLLAKADAITVVTRPLAERVAAFPAVDQAKVHLIPNGVDYPFWAASSGNARAAGTVLAVGRLEAVKGHDVLIEAIARMRREGADVRLVLVGEGALRDSLVAQAQACGVHDRVTFTGRLSREELREQMGAASVFALASRSEGMPMALMEAMAAGLACVASGVGAVPEVLLPGTGVIVPPEDPQALADALGAIIGDAEGAALLGRNAQIRARQLASANTGAGYEALYVRLAAGSGSSGHRSERGMGADELVI